MSAPVIAIDATSTVVQTSTTPTVAHTCAVSATILWVGLSILGTVAPTSVTYAGQAMTLLASTTSNGGTGKIYLYYKTSPASGANNIIVNQAGSVNTTIMGASYTGASIAGIPDNQVTVVDATATTLTSTVNVGIPGSWLLGVYRNDVGAFTPGANTSIRVTGSGGGNATIIADTNGTNASGSASMTFTLASANRCGIMVSFAPLFIPGDPGDTEVTSDSVLATIKPATSDSSVTSDSVVAKVIMSNPAAKHNSTWANTQKS